MALQKDYYGDKSIEVSDLLNELNSILSDKLEKNLLEAHDELQKLSQNWYSEEAESIGNEFINVYNSLTANTVRFVNSLGAWAQSTANAFTEAGTSAITTSFKQINELSFGDIKFEKLDETQKQGANPGADTQFQKFLAAGESICGDLDSISNLLNAHNDLFSESVVTTARDTIENGSNAFKRQFDSEHQRMYIDTTNNIKVLIDITTNARNAAAGNGIS